MIDMACDSAFTFAIEGHTISVTPPDCINNVIDSLRIRSIIDVDNVNHEPYTVDQIQIFASKRQFSVSKNADIRQGQRYSFVVGLRSIPFSSL